MTDTEYARYRVDYRRAGSTDRPTRTEVSLVAGYTTFESIRTILSVAETGAQDPDTIEVIALQLVPTGAAEAELKAAITAHLAGQPSSEPTS